MRSPPGSRRLWWAAAVLAVLGGLGTVAAFFSSSSSSNAPDAPPRPVNSTEASDLAPAVELANVREEAPPVSLAALSGQPVVMNFFAAWCVPCATELPAFQAVADETKGRVAFLGIDHQDSRRAAKELMDATGVRFPAGYDPDGQVARAYGLRGMPTTVFISAGGRILERRNGEMSGTELRHAIDRHFGPSTSAS